MVSFADKLPDIATICRTNDVKRLDLFGSRARADAGPESDADFVVEFNDPLRAGVFDRFLALHSALELVLGCRVDLIENSAIENPVLRRRIDESRTSVFAA
jgi:uncharacterized protein